MNENAIIIRSLCFTGNNKPDALLNFDRGLNILYGASETGKSFVLEAIDYMFGASTELRDIPERNGYDRVFLGFETLQGEQFTLMRSTQGGNFLLFTGLHQNLPNDQQGVTLGARHSPNNENNVSGFLLQKLGLQGKQLKRNAKGETRALSFRDLAHLCIIDETDIQKKGSPIETGQHLSKTLEFSLFKLLLTGVDDSSYVAILEEQVSVKPPDPKIELIDELIVSITGKLSREGNIEADLRAQLARLETTIADRQNTLRESERTYSTLLNSSLDLRKRIQEGESRRSEISELIARFRLLDEHYKSDLERLAAIKEAGSLLSALPPTSCPLCGALPDHQHPEEDVDMNTDNIIQATTAESLKIQMLQKELQDTITELSREGENFDRIIPTLQRQENEIAQRLNTFNRNLLSDRDDFAALLEKKLEIRSSISIFDQINELNQRKDALSISVGTSAVQPIETTPSQVIELSTSILDDFAILIEKILKDWNFPDAERVQFDSTSRDLIISGKKRGSRGKGMRSITHAAFLIGVLEFCKNKNYSHPGFLVLDSPLLAYREPENDEDDLSGTDVQEKFYEYLSAWTDRQIIIIENITPPDTILQSSAKTTMFSKNDRQGRYGFFPQDTK
ncbi:hypothetical protein A3860_33815 [Niastella vici]|uniref:Rad50/SbcC-type AAA domain-containing protein n=1 Tax=Niastella vici TaxID=1703345 RepID=A0A1V9FPR7_9BACT|nr:hypothetical protein [Niastella vici]OQP60359.1 hypothetical protein A3860_33815 [Niastella vici]